MNYEEALSYLNDLSRFGSKPGLTTIQYLLYLLGNPERDLKIIHIAGTNGKGSTSAMLTRGLMEVGYKVGTYTSPHLFSIRERIKIDDINIDEEEFSSLITEIVPLVDRLSNKNICRHPTFFETITALAFKHFRDKGVDIVILETGMGGRFDATNVTYPLLSVITHIDRDHINFLGYEITKIAEEKCGIIKGGIPVVTSYQYKEIKDVIQKFALYRGSPFYFLEGYNKARFQLSADGTSFSYNALDGHVYDVEIPLIGIHQGENATLAIYASEILSLHWDYNIPLELFISGLKKVYWPGRFQIIRKNPYIITDGAHNLDGVRRLVETLKYLFPQKKVILFAGILKDKEYKKIAEIITPYVKEVILTTPESERALDPYIFAEEFEKYIGREKIKVIPLPLDALNYAKKHLTSEDILLITGSLYLVGKIEKVILKDV